MASSLKDIVPEEDHMLETIEVKTAPAQASSSQVLTETSKQPSNPEEIQRIQVDDEDRLAFRVGVNFITLVLIGLGGWFLYRYFWGQ